MPSTDWWLIRWGAGAAALTAILLAIRVIWVAARTILREAIKALHRINEMADDWLGDKEKGIPPMRERVSALEAAKDELRAAMHTHPEPQPKNAVRSRGRP